MTDRGLVGIVGAGLIGTSVGLALAGDGWRPLLHDVEDARARQAEAKGAGRRAPLEEIASTPHVVLALPPSAVAGVLQALIRLQSRSTFTDTAGIKSQVLNEIETILGEVPSFCGGHPIAGAAGSGPERARRDMFVGRVWALCPTAGTAPEALHAAVAIARSCGAHPRVLAPDVHDQAMAHVSHVPQLVSSVLAAAMASAPADCDLAGPGAMGMTRLAEAEPELWVELVAGNAGPIAEQLGLVAEQMGSLAVAVAQRDAGVVRELITQGRLGRAHLEAAAASRPEGPAAEPAPRGGERDSST